jgi:hypothetical protein
MIRNKMNRLLSAALFLLLASPALAAPTALVNGKIVTMNADFAIAEAMLFEGSWDRSSSPRNRVAHRTQCLTGSAPKRLITRETTFPCEVGSTLLSLLETIRAKKVLRMELRSKLTTALRPIGALGAVRLFMSGSSMMGRIIMLRPFATRSIKNHEKFAYIYHHCDGFL